MRKLQRHLQTGGEFSFFFRVFFGSFLFFFLMWLQCMRWIDDELCGETFRSLQSNFCSRRTAGLSVLGSGRRVLLAPTSSTTGFPSARGTELVETHCSACLPGVAAPCVTQFSVRFLAVLAELLGPVS